MSPDSPPIAAESPDNSQLDSAPQSSTSTTLERSSLESLPDEVLIDIVRNGQAENTNCMAWSLCLVSKRMEPVARQELYRAISILTCRSLRSLCRTLEDKPELGQYMSALNLIVPTHQVWSCNAFGGQVKDNFGLFWSSSFEVLMRSTGLRKLTMTVVDHEFYRKLAMTMVDHEFYSELEQSSYHGFTHSLLEAITRSQHSGSITTILPQLEQVRLMSDARDAHLRTLRDRALVHPEVFKPFLHLPSLSTLECMNDSGIWVKCKPCVQPGGSPTNAIVNANHYEQIKSVVLRDSDCNPTDIMDLVDLFPVLEVLFVHNCLEKGSDSRQRAVAACTMQMKADQFEKRYLLDSLEKLQDLNTLAFIPHSDGYECPDYTRDFLGPSNFLSLKNLCNLTSISTLITVFASPDVSTTGHLTASPVEVLPRSLRFLNIIVHNNSGKEFRNRNKLDQIWQPRVAALGFMEQLASICSTEFPSLRQVEYIWAVNRITDIQMRQRFAELEELDWSNPEHRDYLEGIRLCDGSVPLCCGMHGRIQALSPDTDYTSKAEGIVSPFKDRFDSLELAFKNAGVTFEVIELKEYSDFFFHWQQGRK